MFDSFFAAWQSRILSLMRVVVALMYLQHGLTKFFGFPGPLPANLTLFPGVIGGVIEIGGSVLLILGLYTRLAAFIMSGEMAVAYWYAHAPRGPFPFTNGGEPAVLFCFVFLYLVFAGGGAWSLDARRK